MNNILENLRKELRENSNPEIKKSGERFFKEEVKLYGIKTSYGTKLGKEYFKSVRERPKKEIFTLCEELFKSGYMEESFIACNWSYYIHKNYQPDDFKVFKKWVSMYVTNWATCDTLCNHTIGEFIMMYPEFISELKIWCLSKNRWMRRASAVSLIVPARKGLFLKEIFDIADILLLDKDDMVQKGYGWMLKVAADKHLKEVFEYVMNNKASMPRTSLRYAIEKMPSELKAEAMKR